MNTALILEDNDDVRGWLAGLLRRAFPGVAITQAASLGQARQYAGQQQFDLALIDINLPDGTGVDLVPSLRRQCPGTYCVMATILDDDENVFRALQAGAQGYLLKDQPDDKLVESLRGILNGDPPLSPPVARRILGHFRQPAAGAANDAGLTEREREILTLIAKGLNRTEIANIIGNSPTTVASHIGAVYRKLDIASRSEAAVEAVRLGLIRP